MWLVKSDSAAYLFHLLRVEALFVESLEVRILRLFCRQSISSLMETIIFNRMLSGVMITRRSANHARVLSHCILLLLLLRL